MTTPSSISTTNSLGEGLASVFVQGSVRELGGWPIRTTGKDSRMSTGIVEGGIANGVVSFQRASTDIDSAYLS
ncbi:hypothetical protein CA54_38410 [Symmachiella macrocystis]|uniref:Uncharacterized protein n=1 Tax=Symmachiella macrocystis TaxID=2527985 RepID=A0A5C6BU16_9PLAN|nr:hypothetical protein CA54_38410 [Symmachiella macrocystis]